MINRTAQKVLQEWSQYYPVLALTGPRQSGKTTLVKFVYPEKVYVSLEDPDQREFALEDPRGFLARFPSGAILDEVQRCPVLFSYLQGMVDHDPRPGLFILTGSQHFDLLSGITQSLAGRVGLVQLLPFSLSELRATPDFDVEADDLIWKGLYPPLYDRKIPPAGWYANYVMTYIERDVRQMLNIRDLSSFQRFLRMCAARTGQLLNLASLGNDCGITHNTAKAWLSILEASYIVFLLQPYNQNYGKRLVKTPKLYFHDTGLAAWLLSIQDRHQLSIHPMRGALFENMVISELLKNLYNNGLPSNLFFWRDNIGTEVDLIYEIGNDVIAVEMKSGQTVTKDYFSALEKWSKYADSPREHLYVVYGGDDHYVRSGIQILSWKFLADLPSAIKT